MEWYRQGTVASLVLEYYVLLRSLLRSKPHLRSCLTRCRHCRIYFITDPRNAGRTDLGCPFGCGGAHRRQCSTQRSVAYYREDMGKIKKKVQNERRKKTRAPPTAEQTDVIRVDEYTIMLSYVRMLTSLIEGRRVSMEEVKEMLARALRQRSMAYGSRFDHIVAALRKHPP